MKCLILCAGECPSLELIKKRASESSLLIGVDNGIAAFKSADIIPHIIIGDMDSASEKEIEFYNNKITKIIRLIPEKDETDTECAISIAKEHSAKSICLLGATGNRLDHTIANLFLLKFALYLDMIMTIEDDFQEVFIAKDEFLITGTSGDIISLFPVDETANVTVSSGLYYPLKNLTLKNSETRGISNIMTSNKVKVYSTGLLWIIKNKKSVF